MANKDWEDAFENQVTKTTTSKADIAGHYPYNPERWRVFVDGTRQDIQYGAISQFTDAVDGHELSPGQGETVSMQTTERYRYVVGDVVEPSFAYNFNRALETGDKAVVGYGYPDLSNDMADADGWFLIYTPDMEDTEVRCAEYRAGTEVDGDTVHFRKPLTVWKRIAITLNWYNVGNAEYIETYTENGNQYNPVQAATSVDDGMGAESGNQPITFSVQRGASSSSLTLQAGSAAVQNYGEGGGITRDKTHSFTASIGTTGTWVPLHAMRVDPDRNIVNVQVSNTDIVGFSGTGDVTVMPIAVNPANTDASGFSTPSEHSATNSAIETTSSVSTFPDSTGTAGSSASNPGGYQLGFASWYESGSGSKTSVSSGGKTRKRAISDRDICVFIGNATVTGDVEVETISQQDW